MMPIKDPEKRRIHHANYLRERYANDPEYKQKHLLHVAETNHRQRQRAKEIVSIFRQNGCLLCSESESCCLSAHHLDPTSKDDTIAALVSSHSLTRLQAELEKCVCLCENCHRKVHAGILELNV